MSRGREIRDSLHHPITMTPIHWVARAARCVGVPRSLPKGPPLRGGFPTRRWVVYLSPWNGSWLASVHVCANNPPPCAQEKNFQTERSNCRFPLMLSRGIIFPSYFVVFVSFVSALPGYSHSIISIHSPILMPPTHLLLFLFFEVFSAVRRRVHFLLCGIFGGDFSFR